MSQYVVISPEGRRFGPTDFQTLSDWAREGRVTPGMTVEDLLGGTTMTAAGVPGLFDEGFEAPPVYTERQTLGSLEGYANFALGLGIASLLVWCIPVVGLLVTTGAILFGFRSLASRNHVKALVGLCLGVCGLVLHLALMIVALVIMNQK